MNNCGCGQCQPNKCKKKCGNPCGCAEPVFSIEALSDDPSTLKFNVSGKTIWYDFSQVVKNSETCTTLIPDTVNRTLNYNGECGQNNITARELGAILHLADIGDVDADSIGDNGILVYQKDSDCGVGCEGLNNSWTSKNPIEIGGASLEYVLGSDGEGRMKSLMPPTDTSKFSYLAWAGAGKAMWKKPSVVATPPVKDGKVTQLYLDENTGEIVAVRRNP